MCLRVGVQVQNGLKRSRFEKLLVGFDGGQRHPVEREQQHQHDQPERQIKRHQPPRQRFEIAHAFGMIGSRRRAHRLGAGEELSHALSLLPVSTPRAGPAQFAASKNRSDGRAQSMLSPAAISGTARGACPVRGKVNAATAEFSHCSPCCHVRHRARGLPRSRQENASTAEFSHCSLLAAISGTARGACPVRGKERRSDGRVQSLLSPCCHFRRCKPNHESRMAASRNGIIAVEIAAPSPR